MYPLVDLELWFDSTGANKRGQVHGIGHSLDIHIQGTDVTSHSLPRPVTQEDITTAINAVMSPFVQTELVPILSRIPGYRADTIAPQAPSGVEAPRENDGLNLE